MSTHHHLKHELSVLNRIERRLGQQDLAVVGFNLKLLLEGIVPDVASVGPVLDNTIFERVGQIEHRSSDRSLLSDHNIFNFDTFDLLFVTQKRTTHHRREDGSRELGRGEPAFYKLMVTSGYWYNTYAGSVIADNGSRHG